MGFIEGLVTGLAAAIAVGTWGFWLFIAIASCFILWGMEYERGFGATATLIISLLVVHFLLKVNLLSLVSGSPWVAVGCFVGYFIVGAWWGLWVKFNTLTKWLRREHYDRLLLKFKKDNGLAESEAIPDTYKQRWLEIITREKVQYRGERIHVLATKEEHAGRIILWMCYWPWSMAWFILNDPVKKIFQKIYENLSGAADRIVAKNFSGTEADLTPPTTPPPANRDAADRLSRLANESGAGESETPYRRRQRGGAF